MSEIKLTKTQLEARRLKAQYMVLVERKEKREVAKILGVTPKAISHWAKQYNWVKQLREIDNKGGLGVLMDGYFEYVKLCVSKETSLKQKALWDKYLQRLGADLTKEAVWG